MDTREELAVASLLWDLVDPKDARESDFVDSDPAGLWALIGQGGLIDMKDVHRALGPIGSGNDDQDTITNLDEIFFEHGFWVDKDMNGSYTPGDEIGRAANMVEVTVRDENGHKVKVPPRPNRRNTPPIGGANLLISVIDEQGQLVEEGTIQVSIEYEDYPDRNYAYSVDLAAIQDGLLALYPPPSHIPATVSLQVVTPTGGESDTLIVDNDVYWLAVFLIERDYIAAHIFDLSKTGEITTLAPFTQYIPVLLN